LRSARLTRPPPLPGLSITLDVEDSRGDPKEAADVAQKFASRGDVLAVVGDFSSTAALAASPIYQRAGIIMMTPTASHPDITKAGNYIFRDTPIASFEVKAVMDWAKELGFKKVAVIDRNDDCGRAYGELFKSDAAAYGADVVSLEYINPGEQDLKPLITGLRAKKPDVVMLAMFQVEAALLLQQSRDMAFKPVFMSGAGLFNPQLLSLAGSAANGLLVVSTYFPGSLNPQVQAFVAAHRERFKTVPSKFAAHSFDAARLIANAIKVSGSTEPAKVRDALAATKGFASVIGSVSIDHDRCRRAQPGTQCQWRRRFALGAAGRPAAGGRLTSAERNSHSVSRSGYRGVPTRCARRAWYDGQPGTARFAVSPAASSTISAVISSCRTRRCVASRVASWRPIWLLAAAIASIRASFSAAKACSAA
jgi:branched-chain amino acid transport system substrate-binding protein